MRICAYTAVFIGISKNDDSAFIRKKLLNKIVSIHRPSLEDSLR